MKAWIDLKSKLEKRYPQRFTVGIPYTANSMHAFNILPNLQIYYMGTSGQKPVL